MDILCAQENSVYRLPVTGNLSTEEHLTVILLSWNTMYCLVVEKVITLWPFTVY